jgi:hypothetical protein
MKSSFALNVAFHQPVLNHALDTLSLQSLQALVILSFSYFTSNFHTRLLGTLGMLSSLLPLASPAHSDAQDSHENQSHWRRLYSTAIFLERVAYGTSNRPLTLSIPQASSESEWSSACGSHLWALCNIGVEHLMRIKSWSQSEVKHDNQTQWKNEGESLSRHLDEWWHKIPVQLKFLEGDSDIPCRVLLRCIRATYVPCSP